MKQIKNSEYEEFLEYKEAVRHGQIITPAALEIICEACGNDPEEIGKHMLSVLHNIRMKRDKRGGITYGV